MRKTFIACTLLGACATAPPPATGEMEATVVVRELGGVLCLRRESLEQFIQLRDAGEQAAASAMLTNPGSTCIITKPNLSFRARTTDNPQILRARSPGTDTWFYLFKGSTVFVVGF